MNQEDELFRPEPDARPVREKSSGCGWKFVLLLLAALGSLTMLCCCGIGISIYSMVPKIEEDPALARQSLAELLTIELPERLQPKLALRMNMLSLLKAKGVIAEGSGDSGLLIVASIGGTLGLDPNFQQNIEEAIKKSANENDMVVESTETREFEIGGKTVPFVFMKGIRSPDASDDAAPAPLEEEAPAEPAAVPAEPEAPAEPKPEVPAEPAPEAPANPEATEPAEAADSEPAGQVIYQVRAMIPTPRGPILFLLVVPEKDWNEEEVVQMIESIQIP